MNAWPNDQGAGAGLPSELSAEDLARLAAQRPDLWQAIEQHPHAYAELQMWIADRRREQAIAAPRAAAPRTRSRGMIALAGVLAAVLLLGGVGTGLALTGTWPFGADSPLNDARISGAAETGKVPTFADGIEKKWTVSGGDIEAGASLRGHLPRMMGPINVAERADQPIQLRDGVLMSYTPEGAGDVPPRWALVNAETGAAEWKKPGGGYVSSCAVDSESTAAVCNTTFVDQWKLVGLDAKGVRFEQGSEAGGVQASGRGIRVLAENRVISFDSDGRDPRTRDVSGISAAVVGNARMPECVWLYGADTVSYAGSSCTAPADEVLTEKTAFNWAVVGDDEPVILIDGGDGLSAFDAKSRARLWEMDGRLPGWYQQPQLVRRTNGDGVLVWRGTPATAAIADLRSGELTPLDIGPDDGMPVIARNQVVLLGGSGDTFSEVGVFDPTTGERVYTGSFPAVEDGEVTGGPLGVMIGHPVCRDCSTAEGANVIDHYTFLGPAVAADQGRAGAVTVSAPDGIPGCPSGTILLAWAELADGWVLVCGVSATQPSYVAYRAPGGGQAVYSVGSDTPTGAQARAAVRWEPALRRYVADLGSDRQLTVDYDLGTASLLNTSTQDQTQNRLVRWVFVPIGSGVRTIKEAAADTGAFEVKAPEQTAEDQVRYMMQVLEKAEQGRAKVKGGAFAELNGCTVKRRSAYRDLIAEWEEIRQNRAEVLDALDAMPVDKIPQGQALLGELRRSIDYSHDANGSFVDFARQAGNGYCVPGRLADLSATNKSDAWKRKFTKRWNRVIAPGFHVRTFSASNI